MVSKTSCTLSLSVVVLVISLLLAVAQQYMQPSHWLWPAVYYHVHRAAIEQGHLTIIDHSAVDSQNGSLIHSFGNPGQEPSATIIITDGRYFKDVVTGIDVGLGESVCNNILSMM